MEYPPLKPLAEADPQPLQPLHWEKQHPDGMTEGGWTPALREAFDAEVKANYDHLRGVFEKKLKRIGALALAMFGVGCFVGSLIHHLF